MDGEEVYESLNNAWLGLCRRMRKYPEASTQSALNMLGRMLAELRSKMDAEEKAEKQAGAMSIEEWIAWFEKNEEGEQ